MCVCVKCTVHVHVYIHISACTVHIHVKHMMIDFTHPLCMQTSFSVEYTVYQYVYVHVHVIPYTPQCILCIYNILYTPQKHEVAYTVDV